MARWLLSAYEKKLIEDPAEGVKILQRLVAKQSISAMGSLGRFYTYTGRAPAWKDEPRGTKLLQDCTAFKMSSCHNNLGLALQFGRGIDRDIVAAWAYYDVGRQLSSDTVMKGLAQLDNVMTPGEKDEARKKSKDIVAQLKNVPVAIAMRRDP